MMTSNEKWDVSDLPSSDWLIKQIEQYQLGLETADGLAPCAISLSGYTIAISEWQQALSISQSLAVLYAKVVENEDWVRSQLKPLHTTGSFLIRLFRAREAFRCKKSVQSQSVARHDLMMNKRKQWCLVESNSIAAGMGPFNQQVLKIHRQINPYLNYVDNPAVQRQAQALYQAACRNSESKQALLVFAVQENEDNVYDQNYIAREIERLGGRVVFKTLRELFKQASINSKHEVSLIGEGRVHLIYYRTGYNLSDYQSELGEYDALLTFRARLESCQLVVCPSIDEQLATSKWIQMKLSQMSEYELVQTFGLNIGQAHDVYSALVTSQPAVERESEISKLLQSGDWLLKTQAEGGGSVHEQWSNREPLLGDEILMERIRVQSRDEAVVNFRRHFDVVRKGVTSELGIFTLGADQQYGGYLLRSKAALALEAGVHRGQGFLDVLTLK